MPYQRVNQLDEYDRRSQHSHRASLRRTAIQSVDWASNLPASASNLQSNLTQTPLLQTATHQPPRPIQAITPARQDKVTPTLQRFSGGKSIPTPVRTKMEKAFNTSFADVNIHEGAQAQAVNAIAYTQGNHIHFAPGQFNPDTISGQTLLGHELAHVVQQRQGRVKPTGAVKGLPLNDNLALEREADELGRKAAQG